MSLQRSPSFQQAPLPSRASSSRQKKIDSITIMPSMTQDDLRPWSRGASQQISPVHIGQGNNRKSPSFSAHGSASPYGIQGHAAAASSLRAGDKALSSGSASRSGGKGSSRRKQRGASNRSSKLGGGGGGGSGGIGLGTSVEGSGLRKIGGGQGVPKLELAGAVAFATCVLNLLG